MKAKKKVKCPKCKSNFVGDIGYDVWQCFNCDNTWKQKSKIEFEK